jgi:hypothetical protein
MKTGVARLPLHTGKAPAWLFQRMKELGREIILVPLTYDGLTKLGEIPRPLTAHQ